ncbi:class I SAM-dependent methyltransferase [Solidesulfovibrio sp.]
MFNALANDLAQRLLTGNKHAQKVFLKRRLRAMALPGSAAALDFGCGTALFAPAFTSLGLRYHGYDIDQPLLNYAARLYRGGVFTASKDLLRAKAPFDVIVANCCFHHIPDAPLQEELVFLKSLLADAGWFILIDILAVPDDPSWIHRQFMKLEQGAYVRTREAYRHNIERHFTVRNELVSRSTAFSLNLDWFPIYNDLLVLECRKDPAAGGDGFATAGVR